MSGRTRSLTRKTGIQLSLFATAFIFFAFTELFAQMGAVDVGICRIRELGVGPYIDISAAPAPCPNTQDGLARSSTHYFYTSNGGAPDSLYKIDFTGATVGTAGYPGANFQALAFVTNADPLGNDRLYGLDVIGNQMVEFDPVSMLPTGFTILIPGTGIGACSGGNGYLFVQMQTVGYQIRRYDTLAGTWGFSFATPMGGTLIFDGLSFRGGRHIGTVVVGGGSDIWRYAYPGPWAHIGAGYPTVPFTLSALGAN